MAFTEQDLAKILQQPGYSIVGAPLAAPLRKSGVGEDLGSISVYSDPQSAQRPSRAVPWPSERHFQAAVIAECDRRAILQPEYGLVCHIPNENAHRQPGVRAGMPDLFLPAARGVYHGWYCELKIGNNKPTQLQLDMHNRLRRQGYQVALIWDSVDEVMKSLEEYLNL